MFLFCIYTQTGMRPSVNACDKQPPPAHVSATNDLGFMDHPILIDLTDNTISHDNVDHKSIGSFIEYNLPSSVLSTVGAS